MKERLVTCNEEDTDGRARVGRSFLGKMFLTIYLSLYQLTDIDREQR